MIVLGFTGTRSGMSEKQRERVETIFKNYEKTETPVRVVHGGCVGADKEFHDLAKQYGFHITVRPGYSVASPEDLSHRCEYSDADFIYEPDTHFKRNRAIVEESNLMLATPYNDIERGGTWYTINYARKHDYEIKILER
jgi:hypothetical protein